MKSSIKTELGFCAIDHITPTVIENYINEVLTKGRLDGSDGLSTKTMRETLTIIKDVLNYAQHLDYGVRYSLVGQNQYK